MTPHIKTHAARKRHGKRKAPISHAAKSPRTINTTPPFTVPTSESSLFALPRELRDTIYGEVWKQTTAPFKIRYGPHLFGLAHYGVIDESITSTVTNSPNVSSSWIFTGNQVLQEATEELQRCSACVLLSDVDYPPKSLTRTSITISKNRPILTPWHAHSLDIGQFKIREYMSLASDGRTPCSLIHLLPVNDTFLRELKQHIPLKARLRHLSFSLRDNCFNHQTVVTQAEPDFGALHLAALPALTSVSIKVEIMLRIMVDEVLKKTVKEDVEDLGIALLGGNAAVSYKFAVEQQVPKWCFDFKKV